MIMLVEVLLTSWKSQEKRQLMRNQSPRVLAHPINEKKCVNMRGPVPFSSQPLVQAPMRLGGPFAVLSCRGLPPVHPRERTLKSPAHPYTEYEPPAFRAS